MNLSEEQKDRILKEWSEKADDPPSLLKLTQIAFPELEKVDGRCKEGKLVKEFLANNGLRARPSNEYKPKSKIVLSSEQEEYCKNNASMMSFVEMARILFANETLNNLSQEAKVVKEYIELLGDSVTPFEDRTRHELSNYKSPKTQAQAIQKIKKFTTTDVDSDKLPHSQKQEIESLIGYLGLYRFNHQINTYTNQAIRDLFESSFIRYTHDKSDLSQEEVDQYIVLSVEVVISSNIQRRVEHLHGLLDDAADDTEGRRISMSLVEAISSAQNEYNQSVNRQHKLLGDLKEKRSDKLKNKIKENASIITLVEAWKNEESRKKMIGLADLRKEVLKEEMGNLQSMDELKARILGISEDDVLN